MFLIESDYTLSSNTEERIMLGFNYVAYILSIIYRQTCSFYNKNFLKSTIS